MSLTNFDSEF